MRRQGSWFWLLAWAGGALVGCSLTSLDDLVRCDGEPASAECPLPGPAAGGAEGGVGAGAAAGQTSGGGELDAAGASPIATGDWVLSYADHSSQDAEPNTASKAIRSIFSIANMGSEPVPLSELSLRYYYTLEAAEPQVFNCDFVHPDAIVNDCAGVVGSFGKLQSTQATNYYEVSFVPPAGKEAEWVLPALGGRSGTLTVRAYKQGFALQDQTNDYSYDATKIEVPAPWARVTLYRRGVLVAGVEPP